MGQTLVKANNLVVIAEKGEKDDGFAAIDDLFFKIDPEFLDHCKTMPPSVTTKYLEKKLLNLRQIQMVQPHQLQTPAHPQVPFLTATLTLKEPLAVGRFGKRKWIHSLDSYSDSVHQIHSLDGWKWSIENPANLTEGGHQTPPEHQANFLYVDVITNFKITNHKK